MEFKLNESSFSQTATCQVHNEVIELLSQPSVYIGFDLLRYSRETYAIEYIALLANKFPNKVILSNGIRYKTDLTMFAGEGYLLNARKNALSDIYRRLRKAITDDRIFDRVIA